MKNLKTFAIVMLVGALLAGCKFGSSPTATFKAFYEAQKKKDAAAVKKTLSKSSLDMLEKGAKEQGKSLDTALTEDSPGAKTDKMPETRNEKIDGTNATLEVQDENSKSWQTVYFVKEDGDWKIALDKTVQEMLKKAGQPAP